VYLGENFAHEIMGKGNVSIVILNGKVREVPNVLHVLIMRKNLLSVKQFAKFGTEVTIRRGSYFLSKSSQLITTCKLENDLYKLGISNVINGILANATSSNTSANLWHERLGHTSQGRLQTMVHKNIAIGLDLAKIIFFHFCKSCNV
jgi:hypothetical protein